MKLLKQMFAGRCFIDTKGQMDNDLVVIKLQLILPHKKHFIDKITTKILNKFKQEHWNEEKSKFNYNNERRILSILIKCIALS